MSMVKRKQRPTAMVVAFCMLLVLLALAIVALIARAIPERYRDIFLLMVALDGSALVIGGIWQGIKAWKSGK